MKWARIIDNVVDTISFDPDRTWVEPVYEERPSPENPEEMMTVEVTPGHWNGVTSEWTEVPDDVYGGYIRNADGSFSAPPPPPPPTDYALPAYLPWDRMTEEEAETIQEAIDAAPVKTRNMINKATSFVTGTDAFIKLKAIIVQVTSQARAEEIMGPPLSSEMSAIDAA